MQMGFGAKWRNWISFCLSSSFSIMMNESPVGFFNASRGLRQRDSISPFLFIMVSEVLSSMIKKVEMGFISGFRVGSSGVIISHLQFVDDTMIFCNANIT